MVTRPTEAAGPLTAALATAGATVIALPVIEIGDPDTWGDLDAAVAAAGRGAFDWVAFTSAAAARRYAQRARLAGAGTLARVAAVGDVTAAAARAAGLRVEVVPPEFDARALAASLGTGGRLLLPRAAGAPAATVRLLRARGWEVTEVTAYVNRPATTPLREAAAVRRGDFDCVTFASGSAVRAFTRLVSEPVALDLHEEGSPTRLTACLGPATARVATEAGFRVDVVAKPRTAAGLVAALEAAYASAATRPEMAP